MPNNVSNSLKIHYADEKTMNKIKTMIIDEEKEKNKIFTMEKLLPRSMMFADSEHYDLDWNCAIWGTKWDAYNSIIIKSGSTLILL
jgi:hypothetical protein